MILGKAKQPSNLSLAVAQFPAPEPDAVSNRLLLNVLHGDTSSSFQYITTSTAKKVCITE